MSKRSILIVDKNPYEREKLKINLSTIGNFSIREIENFEDFSLFESTEEKFSLILLDILFPDSRGGLRLLDSMFQDPNLQITPKIVVSRESDPHIINLLQQDYKIGDYILKPYQLERLTKSIHAILPEEERFFYSFQNSSVISMSVEDLIAQQLSISRRNASPLSIIFITPHSVKLSSPSNLEGNEDYLKDILDVLIKYVKLSVRSSDIALLVNQREVFVLLHSTGTLGAQKVLDKIKKGLGAAFSEQQESLEGLFHLSFATFPDEGNDIDSLIFTAMKKIHTKSALDKIADLNKHKFKSATVAYKKYT